MNSTRGNHGAAELSDGRVLVVGGRRSSRMTAGEVWYETEIFTAGRSGELGVWRQGPALPYSMSHPSVQALKDGRAIVTNVDSHTAFLYNNQAEQFEAVEEAPNEWEYALGDPMLLPDGRVLYGSWNLDQYMFQVFDPAKNCFVNLGLIDSTTSYSELAVLPSGEILLMQVDQELSAKAAILNIESMSIRELETGLTRFRLMPSLAILEDGRLLLVGGLDGAGSISQDAEIFDPANESFQRLNVIFPSQRIEEKLVVKGRRVFRLGGYVYNDEVQSPKEIEVLDLDLETVFFSKVQTLTSHIFGQTLVLRDGSVMLLGGGSRSTNFVEKFVLGTI